MPKPMRCPRCRRPLKGLHHEIATYDCPCGAFIDFRPSYPDDAPFRGPQGPFPNPRPGLRSPPLVRVSPKKKALLVGVSYKNRPYALKGCVKDVQCMKYMLITKFNFSHDSILVLTEEEKSPYRIPTRWNMIMAMHWLVQDCQAGDSLVFHYSGHGSQQQDYDGDEVDGYDETLCPLDFEEQGMIVDDEINEILVRPLPHGVRLHAIVDACHSGTVLDLPYVCKDKNTVWEKHSVPAIRKGTRGGEAICFSGCDDDQTSADTKALAKITSTGAMTFSFIKAIEQGEGTTYGSLLRAMCDGVDKVHKKPKVQSALTNMLLEGSSYKEKIQEPKLSSSYLFDVNSKPFYL